MEIKVAKLDSVVEELSELIYNHWTEVSADKDKMPLAPDWPLFYAKEAAGELLLLVAVNDGKIVGYFSSLISQSLHYATTKVAITDALYVAPEYRKSSLGMRIIDVAEIELRTLGVQKWFAGSKLDELDISPLYRRKGFEPCELYHSKWIGD